MELVEIEENNSLRQQLFQHQQQIAELQRRQLQQRRRDLGHQQQIVVLKRIQLNSISS